MVVEVRCSRCGVVCSSGKYVSLLCGLGIREELCFSCERALKVFLGG